MANQYTALLAALGATGMTHADAVELAMGLVAEDAIDPVDNNRIARKIAGLVMADTVVTGCTNRPKRQVTDGSVRSTGWSRRDLTQESRHRPHPASRLPGLSVGMLDKAPGCSLRPEMACLTMVEAGMAAISPDGFEGALFNEGLPGGRNLMTYAYTDVMDPWEEMFETAYGRLELLRRILVRPRCRCQTRGRGSTSRTIR